MKTQIEKSIDKYYEREIAPLAASSRATYASIFTEFMVFCGENGVKEITDITEETIEKYVERKRSNNVSDKAIQYYVGRIRKWLKFAENPIKYSVKISSFEKKKRLVKDQNRWFTCAEIYKILNSKINLNGNEALLRLITRLLVETGMRVHELSEIKLKNLDLENRTIFIENSKTRPRHVFFTEIAKKKLEEYMSNERQLGAWETTAETENCLLFEKYSLSKIKSLIDNMLRQLGLKQDKDGRGAHTFRHYNASYLYYEGNMDINDLSKLLGDTPEIIVDRYLHPTPKWLRKRYDSAMEGWWTDFGKMKGGNWL